MKIEAFIKAAEFGPQGTDDDSYLNDYKDRLTKKGNSKKAWLHHGLQLIVAADHLHKLLEKHRKSQAPKDYPGPILGPMQLLRGYALEVLLKTLWLSRKGDLVIDGDYKGPTHHKLEEYAGNVGFKLNDKERRIFREIQFYLNSIGRYPVAKRHTLTLPKKSSKGRRRLRIWNSPNDDKAYEKICERLIKEVQKKMEKPSS